MVPRPCKRLAEVDFPVDEVSRHAVRSRHGHPSTLHLWWARRPLASRRAVLMALLLPDPCDEHCPAAFRRCRGCSFGTSVATELGSPPAAPWWAAHGEEPPPVVAHAHPVGLCHASLPPYSCGGAIGQRTEPAHSRHGGTQADGGDCERTWKPLGSVCRTSSVTNGARLGSERWGAPPPLPRGHGQRPRCAGGLDVVESRPAQ